MNSSVPNAIAFNAIFLVGGNHLLKLVLHVYYDEER
jgi:hypothetical protein